MQLIEAQFGNYQLLRLLRRGNLTTLYLGRHMHLGYSVVVKVLNSWIATDAQINRFCAEARLHASMHHPNIVRVLDFGMQGHIPFMVLEFASRGTLEEYFPGDVPLSPASILPVVEQIAQALQYIHSHQLIHRDIKPQNILVSSTGDIWISDFGIAVAVQPWSKYIQYDTLGTALYASPEQIEGHPLMASDQYSLGVLVYTWLSGRPPFVGTSSQLCLQHLYQKPSPLSTRIASISPEVEWVVMKALAKDPYQRFEHVLDFAHALRTKFLEQGTHSPHPAIDPLENYLAPNKYS